MWHRPACVKSRQKKWCLRSLKWPIFRSLWLLNGTVIHYIYYSTFLSTQSASHCRGNYFNHHQCAAPPGWCDGSHIVPERTPHTSLLVERRQSDEANWYLGMIRRPWWTEAKGQIWPGCRGYTPTLFERHPGIFCDHRKSGHRFNVSSEGRCC